jgi:hypothetical protein
MVGVHRACCAFLPSSSHFFHLFELSTRVLGGRLLLLARLRRLLISWLTHGMVQILAGRAMMGRYIIGTSSSMHCAAENGRAPRDATGRHGNELADRVKYSLL